MNLNKKIVITGGGSGGHVSVVQSIISGLKDRYDNALDQIIYIGGDSAMESDRGGTSLEEKIFKDSDVKFVQIRAGKLQRSFTFNSIRLLFRTILGFVDAYKLLKKYKPDIVISVGGFVSVPVMIIANLMKIPVYLHEQTAAIGLSNNIGGKIAKKIFVAFEDSVKYFPKEKTVVVGNPIREEIFNTNGKSDLIQKIKIMQDNSLPIIYISGGGLGSHIINLTVRDALIHLLDKYQIILQTGDNQTYKDYDVLLTEWKKLPKNLVDRMYVTKFVNKEEIGYVFNACDFFIGRSGANTVYELGVLRKPCILIPIPWVTHNEQEKNAKILEKVGLAKIVLEGSLSRETLLSTVDEFSKTLKNRINSINNDEIEKVFTKDAVAKILDEILDK